MYDAKVLFVKEKTMSTKGIGTQQLDPDLLIPLQPFSASERVRECVKQEIRRLCNQEHFFSSNT